MYALNSRRTHRDAALSWRTIGCTVLTGLLSALLGCQMSPSPDPVAPVAVERAWGTPTPKTLTDQTQPAARWGSIEVIARVNGRPIERSELVALLIGGRGVEVMEQMVALEAARQLAVERELTVSAADIDAEYDRSLDALLGKENIKNDPDSLRRKAGESLLGEMLARRGVSRVEYRMVMKRNAYLRKLAEAGLELDEAQLRREFERTHGERVEIRHVQLASRADVDHVLEQGRAGVDFAELARRYSANEHSRDSGGLLPPFSADDEQIPAALRRAAFSLDPGTESGAIRVDDWVHLIRVERRIPALPISFEQARDAVERSLRERLVADRMQRSYADLLRGDGIEIVDPTLRDLYDQRQSKVPRQ